MKSIALLFACHALILAAAQAQTALYTFVGDAPDDRFGVAAAPLGDISGDGIDDFIIGAQFDDENGESSGSARVFSGADGSTLFTFYGDHLSAFLGFSVSAAGDVDADGIG